MIDHAPAAANPTATRPAPRLRLSVVICTRNRPESLAETLATLWRNTRMPDELVLIDDGRLDHAPIAAAADSHKVDFVYFNKSDRPGLARSRRAGIEHSTGDVLLFLDDDVSLDDRYIEGLMRVYETDAQGDIGGATGRLEGHEYSPIQMLLLRFFLMDNPRREGKILKNFIGVLVRNIDRPTEVDWLAGCNMSYRRVALADAKIPLDLEGWSAGEDRAISYQVGRNWRLIATPEARIVHHRTPSSRIDARAAGFQQVYYNYLHFRRYMPQDFVHKAAFAWLAIGYFVINLMRRDGRRAVGNLDAAWTILRGPRDQRRAATTSSAGRPTQ